MLSSVVEFTAMDSSKLASPVSLDPEEEELLDLEDEMKEEVEEEEEGEDEIRRNSLSDGFLTDEEDLDDEMDEGEEAEQEEPRKYTCSICSEKEEDTKSIFLSKASLRRHLRSSHASACYWACASCGAATPDAEQLKQHLLRTHKVRKSGLFFPPFVCHLSGHQPLGSVVLMLQALYSVRQRCQPGLFI